MFNCHNYLLFLTNYVGFYLLDRVQLLKHFCATNTKLIFTYEETLIAD